MKKLIYLFVFLASYTLQAQVTVNGTIFDETNQPMPGVTVMIKGTTTATSTDAGGNYKITLPAGPKETILTYSFIGYGTVEKTVNMSGASMQTVGFKMEKEEIGLNTVVVSASKRKEKLIDAPASVTVLTAEKLSTNTPLTVVDNLKKVPGVDIMQTGLFSNNVTVRGFNGIFSGSLMT